MEGGSHSPKNLVKVAPGGCRIGKGQSNSFLGVDNEDRSDLQPTSGVGMMMELSKTDGERQALTVPVGGVLLVQHVVEDGHLPVRVGNLSAGFSH